MTFDYYDDLSSAGTHNMGQDTITAANHLYDTLRELYPGKTSAQLWSMIGFCEDVGRDDFGASETYYLTDAKTDMPWAVSNGLGIITFWNYSRDTANRGGTPSPIWSFSKIYAPVLLAGQRPPEPFNSCSTMSTLPPVTRLWDAKAPTDRLPSSTA